MEPEASPAAKSWIRSVLVFFACMAGAVMLTYLVKDPVFTESQVYVLFLLFFAIGLWITEVIPPFATGLLIMAFLVFALGNPNFNSDPQDVSRYANTFSSGVIWLMLGGFFLAAAMSKTKLDIALFSFTVKVSGTKPRNLVIGLMATAMIASMLMSNTACTAMIVAAVTPLVMALGQKSGLGKAVLLGVPIAASTGGMATIIGSPPNVIAAGALENAGRGIDFLGWMVYGLPLAVILTAICCLALLLYYVKDNKPVDLDFLKVSIEKLTPLQQTQRKIVVVVLTFTLLLWLTSEWHGISVAAVSAIPIVFLTLTSVITGKEVRALPWDTLFLVAGGLSLGVALQYNGLLNHYAHLVAGVQVSPLAFLFIFGYVTMAFSNVMSHTATATVLIPLGMAILPESPTAIAMVVGLSSGTAMLLPVSTPPNAIAFSTGMLEQKDFRLGGLISGVLGPLLVILWVMYVSNISGVN
jgi:sodium-dependent dicarboxylate transporter 2/3/5